MHGMTVVVTGGTEGVGRATAHALALRGARVIVVGRDPGKTAATVAALTQATGNRQLCGELADLSVQADVEALADRLLAAESRIDVLINNAGALFTDRVLTVDGIERTFALNHLAYMQLTLRLLPRLLASASPGALARVLCVSSRAHSEARLDLTDLQLTRGYGGWRAYGRSKLCNILFAQALARRVDPERLVVHALHPGVVATRFAQSGNGWRGQLMRRVMDLVSISPTAGADTVVWLATDPSATRQTGAYWVKRRPVAPSAIAQDAALADALWEASAALLPPWARTVLPPIASDAGASPRQ